MPASFVWQPGPNGGTPANAANLNRHALVADIGTPGTPTGDAIAAALAGGGGGGGLTVAATVTAAGALVAGKHNPVDATGGAKTMTLPTGTSGKLLSVEKVDASTNAVTVSGSIRGVGSSTISLVWQNEDVLFASDSAGSWWPVAGHKTKASLDAAYASKDVLALAGVYTPEKYGAVGDGVTDDTAAVQAAVTNCPTNGTVYFTKQYLISAAITLPQNKTLLGTGAFNSGILVKTGTNPVAALVSAAYATNASTSGGPVVIKNMLVKYNSGNTSGHGILLLNYNSLIDSCNISSTPGAGIVLSDQNSAGTTISNTAVENRIVNNKVNQPGTHGIWVRDTSGSGKNTDGYLQSNIVANSGDVAIRNDRAAGWFIDDNHVYASGNGASLASPATVAGAGGFQLTNCWNTYITNNETDGFGAVTNGGTHIAFNIEQLSGRPSVILGNIASANEAGHTASGYLYFRIKQATGGASTATVVMADNVAHCDTTGGASSVWGSFQAGSATLNVRLDGQLVDGPGTTPNLGGTVNFTGTGATTAKGDLLAAAAPYSLARVPVGTDGQVLTADAASAAGVKWAAAAGGTTFTAASVAPGGANDIYSDYGNRAAGIVETMSRDSIDPTSGSPSPGAGTLALTYFTPDQTVTVSNLISATRGTAQAGATLARMALYSIDGTGALTCIARTASDTTLWQSTQNVFTRAIADDGQGNAIASVTLTRGQRYAFAILHVGSTTAPTIAGKGGIAGLMSASPRRGGFVTAQTDIPATITAATITAGTTSGNYYYGRCS